MAKKIVAVQCDPESFDYRMYYDEDDATYDLLFINRGDFSFNKEMKDNLEKMIEGICYDNLSILNQVDDYDSKEENDADRLANVKCYVRDFFNVHRPTKFDREISQIPDDDYWKIIEEADGWNGSTTDEETEIKTYILSIIYGVRFHVLTLRGCCQGDWCEVICPGNMPDKYIDYIEAVFFGTGTEYYISDGMIDLQDEDGNDKEIDDLISEAEASGSCSYTALYRDEDVKDWIAKEISSDATKDDVLLINIKDSYTVTRHNYEIR